jgi:N-acetylmuramoyl-L-alanine amidase
MMNARSTLLACLLIGMGSWACAFETVVVDPGHGGNDEGTKWYHVAEKDLTLAVSNRLSALLREKGIDVVQTRLDDRYVSLDERAEIANRTRNSLLVSIHFNAARKPAASGFETHHFFASPSGRLIAESIQRSLGKRIVSHDRGIRGSDFAVLARTDDCAVLIECGFISNRTEATYYSSADGQDALARALAAGILRVKPVINNDPPECVDAKCVIYATKAAAAERRLALGGPAERETDDAHSGSDTRFDLAGMVTPVKDIMAAFEERE